MTYRRVFVDTTFVDALGDPCTIDHAAAVATFAHPLDEYERGTTRLFSSRAAIGRDDARCQAMRVAAIVPVRRGLRRLTARVAARHPDVGAQRAEVLAIVQRTGITELATTDAWFRGVDGLRVVDAAGATDGLRSSWRPGHWRGGRRGARPSSPPGRAR